MAVINAYIIHEGTMNGGKDLDTVYTNLNTANRVAKDMGKREEWADYKVRPVSVRILNETEGAVGNHLVTINRDNPDSLIRERAIKKLDPEERRVLGL